MYSVQLFTLMLIGLTIYHHEAEAHKGMCAGCPIEIDPNREDVQKTLTGVLAAANSPDVVVKVIKATVQVENGARYVIDFEAKTPGSNDIKICHTDCISRPWLTKTIDITEFNCEPKEE